VHSVIFAKRILFLAISLQSANFALLAAHALSFTVGNPNRIGPPGDSETFQGTITNDTGATLDSTDLFFNFSGFDPVQVTLTQILGNTSFAIPNGTTSAVTGLFSFDLSPLAGSPAVYPADVTIEDINGDVSAIKTVSITTPSPEPASILFAALGTLLLLGLAFTKRKKQLWTLLALCCAPMVSNAQVSAASFVSGPPGISDVSKTLYIALPIENSGTVTATNVQVTSATLRSATLLSPTVFPVVLGAIAPDHSVKFQANFSDTGLAQNTPYLLTVRGTYQVGASTAGFAVNLFVRLPVASPGSNTVLTTTVGSNTVTGAPYTHQPPTQGDDVNDVGPPVPTGPFVPGVPTPNSTSAPVAPAPNALKGKLIRPLEGPNVSFNSNQPLGLTSAGIGCNPGTAPASCAEPSGATGNGVTFMTANWLAAYSTDGTTYHSVDPTTIFPKDAVGYCCDQIVQYAPSVDRFIWLLQGSNGYRLAVASPASVSSSGATSWTYWNLTTSVFGTTGTSFDYPDLSLGNNSLYISWDANCSPNCSGGLQVARISLAQLQAGGTINIDYTHQSDSSLAWGSHLTQDTQDEIFWAGHNNTSSLRIFSWAEGSNTYYWRDVGISSWSNAAMSSKTPDGQDWLLFGFPGNSVVGATRSGNQLWFGWGAGTDSNFQQTHVEMVTLDRGNNFNKTQQVQIWNNSYAFSYPALATNACTGEIGLSLQYGGPKNYEDHVVGFWGDYEVFATANSNFGENRFGDYVTIRQTPGFNGAYFEAYGYGVTNSTKSGTQADVRRVVFGRANQCSDQ
jgi:hypothetical protein